MCGAVSKLQEAARMQESEISQFTEPVIPEHLRAAMSEPGSESLTDLAYRRAREALENALEEARKIRLQSLEDARRARQVEMEALERDLAQRRASAQSEADGLLRRAELEAERIRSEAGHDAREIVRVAKVEAQETAEEASHTLVEARTLRVAADERQREVERLESEFDQLMSEFARRAGLVEEPSEGWWARLMRRRDKK
jgi:hypothetical protein